MSLYTTCERCGGSGRVSGGSCAVCGGLGVVIYSTGGEESCCPYCGGSGRIEDVDVVFGGCDVPQGV